MTNCLQCEKETKNPKFCSKSCSATWTNKKFPKRKSKRSSVCSQCNGKKALKSTLCQSCTISSNYRGDLTLQEAIYEKHHRSSAYALVRTRARTLAKKLGIDKQCKICGYSKHVEIAHVNSISSFSEETLVSKINSSDNLVALCRNCHWELDHKLAVLRVN